MKGLNLSTIQNSCKLITYFVYDGYKEGVNIKQKLIVFKDRNLGGFCKSDIKQKLSINKLR